MIAKTKQWGNSLAVIIPSKKAKELSLKPNDEVNFEVEKKANPLKALFGSMSFDKPTEEILKEARKGESKWW
ncbi:hypothetical protein CMO91_05930 [Candidatus Woesearchaeota archaeon]|nr:hypothetical protein [Candidatus Woesearchaeota archaeon]|tara:strand:+ start:146 stop:361 length:216 start_codon:yes stop_codon:yes gene_type:complete